MLKQKLLLALAVCLPFYSYSNSIKPHHGYTGNAIADSALRWSMNDVLPTPPGLDIQTVIYSYRIKKETADFASVNVQNKNANGTGFVFKQTDNWMPGSLSGTQINKVVGVGSIPRQAWGDGSIEVNGLGSVYDASVVYTYRIDPCYDPQFNPSCPGYIRAKPNIYEFNLDSLYDVTKDNSVNLDRNFNIKQNKENLEDNDKEKKEAAEKLKRKYRLEKAMSAIDASALFAETIRMQQINELSNIAFTQQGYYTSSIPGGIYKDSVILIDSKLPENKTGLRNEFAQQLLHQKMIDLQFKLNN